MKEWLRRICFLLLCLYSLFFIIGSTLAPVFAHYGFYDLSAHLTAAYMYSCHQQPDRSFWILGYPMALCCRCYGVYWSAAIASIFAIFRCLNINLKVFIFITIFAFGDIYINYGAGILRNTGNITRFIAGVSLGIVIVRILDYLFEMKGKFKYENEKSNS